MALRAMFTTGVAAAAALTALPCPAAAQSSPVVARFDVPSQPLARALPLFARQAGVQILAPMDAAGTAMSRPVSGTHEVRAALRQLIAGSGLEIVSSVDGLILLRSASSAAADRPSERLIDGAPALLEEVVVTALRRESAASRTPISIVAIQGSQLEARGADSLSQVRALAPGLNQTEVNTGQRRLSLRGAQSAGESTVGLYVGETPVSGPNSATSDPSSITPDLDLYDLDRVEVLKGPQGTLFGSGAMSGAVRLLYNAPDPTAAAARVDIARSVVDGGGAAWSTHAMVNQPLWDGRAAVRIVAYDAGRPGYVDNLRLGQADVNAVRTQGARIAALIAPRSGTTLSATAIMQDQTAQDSAVFSAALGDYRSDAHAPLPFPNRFNLLSLTAEQTLPFARLTATTAVFDWDSTKYIDTTLSALLARRQGLYCPRYNGVTGPCDAAQFANYQGYIDSILPVVGHQPMDVRSVIHEARLDSLAGGNVGWTLGAFIEDRSDSSVSSTVRVDEATGLPLDPLAPVFQRSSGVDLTQKALYGELSWTLTPRLTVRLGARRYSYDKTSRSQVLITSYINASVAGPESLHRSEASGWVRRATASYGLGDHAMAYVQYAEGFRPGGVNNTPGLDAALVAYAADEVRNHEAGLKTTAANGRLLIDFAVYSVRWSDMQVAARAPNFNFIANAGEATIRGLEVEGQLGVTDRLTARWSLNLIDGRLTSAPKTSRFDATGDVGDRIPYEPRVRFAASLEHGVQVGPDATLRSSIEAAYTGVSGSAFDDDDPYYEQMGEFWLLNGGVSLANGDWSATLRVENILDDAGVVWAASRPEYERNAIGVQPRTVRLSLQRRW